MGNPRRLCGSSRLLGRRRLGALPSVHLGAPTLGLLWLHAEWALGRSRAVSQGTAGFPTAKLTPSHDRGWLETPPSVSRDRSTSPLSPSHEPHKLLGTATDPVTLCYGTRSRELTETLDSSRKILVTGPNELMRMTTADDVLFETLLVLSFFVFQI